jgi:hypothetical protein
MKKLIIIVASLFFTAAGMGAQAHGFQHNRIGTYIGIGFADPFFSSAFYPYPSYHQSFYQPYPTNSLIGGISYRNNLSRMRLQNRFYNGRAYNRSAQRSYRNGFDNGYNRGYRNGRRSVSNEYRRSQYTRPVSSCYEVYYDRHGNRVERSLPASQCRH